MSSKIKDTHSDEESVTITFTGGMAKILSKTKNPHKFIEDFMIDYREKDVYSLETSSDVLKLAGFTKEALIAIGDTMTGHLWNSRCPLSFDFYSSMSDEEAIDGTAPRWGVLPDVWTWYLRLLNGDDPDPTQYPGLRPGTRPVHHEMVAFALYNFVREFWRFPEGSEALNSIYRDLETGPGDKPNGPGTTSLK